MARVAEFQIPSGANSYRYEIDVIDISWNQDRSDYRLLDLNVETDVRAVQPIVTFEAVMVADGANATGTSAADLYELIREQEAQGNVSTFVPDPNATGPSGSTVEIDVVTAPDGYPNAYRVEQSGDRLRRTIRLQGAKWLDPSDTGAGSDKEQIDDINSLSDPL